MQFNYTVNEDRKLFATNLYNIGIKRLMDVMPQVKWGDYSFTGSCSLLSSSEDDLVWSDHAIVAKCNYGEDYRPYVYIGGCVYALHALNYPDINQYIDPTGNIDVFVDIPRVITVDQKSDLVTMSKYYKSVLNEDHSPNALMTHFTNWLLKELYRIFETNFLDILDRLDEYESPELNIQKKIHFSVVQVDALVIKVQVHCKVKNMKELDALLECVFVADKTKQDMETWDTGSKAFNKYCDVYENIFIQRHDSLMDDNIKAILAREVLVDNPQYQHKLYNHIGRLQYLNYIYPMYQTNLGGSVKDFLYFLWEKRDKLSLYNYKKSDDKAFLGSLVDNFMKQLSLDNDPRPYPIKTGSGYKNMTNEDILSLYETLVPLPKRGRSFLKQKVRRSAPVLRRTFKNHPSVNASRELKNSTSNNRTQKIT